MVEEAKIDPRIGVENVRRLTDILIRRYSTMLNRGSKFVNAREISMYLRIWKSIEKKSWVWSSLSADERNEVRDAIYSETDEWLPRSVL